MERTPLATITLVSLSVGLAVAFATCDPEQSDGLIEADPAIEVRVSTTSIGFGSVIVGQTAEQSFTVSNPSTSTSTLTGSVSLTGSAFSLDPGDGSFSLSPGQSMAAAVTFAPIAPESYSGSLTITHNSTAEGSPVTVPLSGTGEHQVMMSRPSEPITFDTTEGSYVDADLSIGNSENSTGDLTGSVDIGGAAFSITSGQGPFSLSPGQSLTITLRFEPLSPGDHPGSLTITHNATNRTSPTSVSLSGYAESQPSTVSMDLSRTSIDFGTVTVNQVSEESFTITNSSSSNEALTATVTSSGSEFSIIDGGGTFSLPPGASRTVTVRFAPTSVASYTGTVSIEHNATNVSSPTSVALTGEGQAEPTTYYTLSVSKTGDGSGTVASSPSGIDCGSSCTASFESGTQVTLTATPATGHDFTGWSGACSGTGDCTLTMTQDQSVTASFTAPTSYTLSVSKTGSGSGTVTSSPSGINCGSTCTASFADGTQVTLTATPASGSTFVGWSGACSGTGTCTVTMTQNQSVTATFDSESASVFAPVVGDAHVRMDVPDGNYGSEEEVWVGVTPTTFRGLIKFDLSAIPDGSTIEVAVLRLYVTNKVDAGQAGICRADKSWIETTVTWDTNVGIETPCVDSSSPPNPGQWWEIDVAPIVTEWITNGGIWGRGFVIDLASGLVGLASRESTDDPELYVQYTP